MEGWSSGRMWEAELPQTTEALAWQASALRVKPQRSPGNTESPRKKQRGNVESLLAAFDSFDRYLAALKDTIRPRQERACATADATNTVLAEEEISRRDEAAMQYLKALCTLKGAADCLLSHEKSKSTVGFLNDVNDLISKSVLIIEEEFKRLLSTYSKPMETDRLIDCLPKPQRASRGEPEAGGGNSTHSEHPSKSLETAIYRTPTLIPTRISQLLNAMAQPLILAGNQQCYRIYRDARCLVLKQTLHKLGVEKLCKYDVHKMKWEALKAKIGDWTQLMRILVKLLLAGERKLCDQVFDGNSFNKDKCFAELAKTGFQELISFGAAIAKSEGSPEKLFALLEMYEVMKELKPEVEIIFDGRFCCKMLETSLGLMEQLAEKTRPCPTLPDHMIELIVSKAPLCRASLLPLSLLNSQWNAAVKSQLLKIPYPSLVLPCSKEPLFHASTGCDEWHRLNFPQDMRLHGRFCGSSDGGWVVVALEEPQRHQLINLNNTSQRIDLPITAEVSYDEKIVKLIAVVPSSSPLNPNCTIAAIIEAEGIDPPGIAIWTEGMDHWQLLKYCPIENILRGNVEDLIYYKDAFHFITDEENLGVFYPDTGEEWTMEQVRIKTRSGFYGDAELIGIHGYTGRLYLVESEGNLFLVVKLVDPGGTVQVIRILKLEVQSTPTTNTTPFG